MKNTTVDLNNHLFEQLERLNDDDLTDEQLEKEVKRAKSMEGLASKIIDNAKLGLDAAKLKLEYGCKDDVELPPMLESKHG